MKSIKRGREDFESTAIKLQSTEGGHPNSTKLGNGIVLLSNWISEKEQVNLAIEVKKLGENINGFYNCNNERFL